MPSLHLPRSRRSLLALGAAATLVGGAVAYRKVSPSRIRELEPDAPSLAALADDFAAVLVARGVHDAVLAGHSMGGMTIMALAAYRPEVLAARARAAVLVATAATSPAQQNARAAQLGRLVISSPALSRAMRMPNGHVFVRSVFGNEPVRAHMDL